MEHSRPADLTMLFAEWWCAGANLAGAQAWRHAQWQRDLAAWFVRPGPQRLDRAMRALRDCAAGLLAWPLDLLRIQHAGAARAGLVPRSLLESRRFERQLGRVEQLALGPLARRP
jgi:hypothetical protein